MKNNNKTNIRGMNLRNNIFARSALCIAISMVSAGVMANGIPDENGNLISGEGNTLENSFYSTIGESLSSGYMVIDGTDNYGSGYNFSLKGTRNTFTNMSNSSFDGNYNYIGLGENVHGRGDGNFIGRTSYNGEWELVDKVFDIDLTGNANEIKAAARIFVDGDRNKIDLIMFDTLMNSVTDLSLAGNYNTALSSRSSEVEGDSNDMQLTSNTYIKGNSNTVYGNALGHHFSLTSSLNENIRVIGDRNNIRALDYAYGEGRASFNVEVAGEDNWASGENLFITGNSNVISDNIDTIVIGNNNSSTRAHNSWTAGIGLNKEAEFSELGNQIWYSINGYVLGNNNIFDGENFSIIGNFNNGRRSKDFKINGINNYLSRSERINITGNNNGTSYPEGIISSSDGVIFGHNNDVRDSSFFNIDGSRVYIGSSDHIYVSGSDANIGVGSSYLTQIGNNGGYISGHNSILFGNNRGTLANYLPMNVNNQVLLGGNRVSGVSAGINDTDGVTYTQLNEKFEALHSRVDQIAADAGITAEEVEESAGFSARQAPMMASMMTRNAPVAAAEPEIASAGYVQARYQDALSFSKSYTDKKIKKAEKTLSSGVAQASAQPNMPSLDVGESAVMAGLGNYSGEGALGLAAAYSPSEGVVLGAGVSFADTSSKNLFRTSASYEFGIW